MKSKVKNTLLAAAFALPIALSSCSTVPSDSGKPLSHPRLLDQSRIELDYVLGHTRRRLVLQAREGMVLGQNFHERQLLQEAAVAPGSYENFWKSASEYAEKCNESVENPCKNAFRLTLESRSGTRTIEGCRSHSAEDSLLSHLIREGEFLLTRRGPSASGQ